MADSVGAWQAPDGKVYYGAPNSPWLKPWIDAGIYVAVPYPPSTPAPGTGFVKKVNGYSPDASGNVNVTAGVAKVNNKGPDQDGNVAIAIPTQPSDINADPAGTAAGVVGAHVLADNPHPVYARTTDVAATEKVTAPGLWRFHQHLALAAVAPCDIVCIGSSSTWGMVASDPALNYVNSFARFLRGSGSATPGTRGHHVLMDQDGWVPSASGVSDVNMGLSLWGKRLAANATMTRTFGSCDGFIIQHGLGSVGGQFTYSIDGGAAQTVTPTASDKASYAGRAIITGLTRGTHTLKITAVGSVDLMGVYACDGDAYTGIRVWNAGHPGTKSGDYTLSASQPALRSHARAIAAIDPALIVIMIGANDFTVGTSGAQWEANVRQMIRMVRAACSKHPSVLLVQSYQKQDVASPTVPWSDYAAAATRIAANTSNVDFVDQSIHYPKNQGADWLMNLLSSDSAHSTDAGHAWMGRTLADHVSSRITPASVPVTQTADPGTPHPSTLAGLVAAWKADTLGADGSKVSSWSPYAGIESATLAQGTTANQPTVRTGGPGDRKYVEFAVASPGASLNQLMQTAAWATALTGAITILMTAKMFNPNEPCRNGNLFSGRPGQFVYCGCFGDNEVIIGAGDTSGSAIATPYAGHCKWKAWGFLFNGNNSALYQSDMDTQFFSLVNGGSYGLPGLTISGNSGGTANSISGAYQEMLIFNRALTDLEITGALARLARDAYLDGYGRAQI